MFALPTHRSSLRRELAPSCRVYDGDMGGVPLCSERRGSSSRRREDLCVGSANIACRVRLNQTRHTMGALLSRRGRSYRGSYEGNRVLEVRWLTLRRHTTRW